MFSNYNPQTKKIERVKPYKQEQQTRMLNITPTINQPAMKIYDLPQNIQKTKPDTDKKGEELEKQFSMHKEAPNKRLIQTFDPESEGSERNLKEKSESETMFHKNAGELQEMIKISHAALFNVEDL